MNVHEASIGGLKMLQWRGNMTLNFRCLTVDASLTPLTNLYLHARPDEAVRNEALGSLNSRMRQIMEKVENLTTERREY